MGPHPKTRCKRGVDEGNCHWDTRAAVEKMTCEDFGHAARVELSRGFAMDALLILSLFVVLAVLAARFGHDSREHLASAEEAFSGHGFSW
jgi:hypothetical protein